MAKSMSRSFTTDKLWLHTSSSEYGAPVQRNIPVYHVTRNSTDVHPRMTFLLQQQLLDQFRLLDSPLAEGALRRTNFAHKNEVGSTIERTLPTKCTPLRRHF
jgi:hypothetical protein